MKSNNGTDLHFVDSLIVHNEVCASLIEFTDGEPQNKKLVKKHIDTVNALKMIDNYFNSSNITFYFCL